MDKFIQIEDCIFNVKNISTILKIERDSSYSKTFGLEIRVFDDKQPWEFYYYKATDRNNDFNKFLNT